MYIDVSVYAAAVPGTSTLGYPNYECRVPPCLSIRTTLNPKLSQALGLAFSGHYKIVDSHSVSVLVMKNQIK